MSQPSQAVYAVGELTRYIKHLLESDSLLAHVQVSGEVSNLTYHGSGHVYFSIKDSDAQLSCVMFRSYAQQAERLKAGDQVILGGNLSVYPPRGNYQMLVKSVRKAGQGDLFQQFVALKEKLQKEGLFEGSRKKPLPPFPRHLAVITSPTGAAIRDILRTLNRRYPHIKVSILPTTVQGSQGKASILRSLEQAITLQPDLLIIARGGGSIEDLWNFNEEAVARAVAACSIPVVSGIGHETDFTIVDFVADKRASTPTAAAELAVPDGAALKEGLREAGKQLEQSLQYYVDFKRQVLDDYSQRLKQGIWQILREKRHELALLQTQQLEQSLQHQLDSNRQVLKEYQQRLNEGIQQALRAKQHELSLLQTQLLASDMRDLLKKGYTLTLHKGQILRQPAELEVGEAIETVFAKGRVTSRVEEVQKENEPK